MPSVMIPPFGSVSKERTYISFPNQSDADAARHCLRTFYTEYEGKEPVSLYKFFQKKDTHKLLEHAEAVYEATRKINPLIGLYAIASAITSLDGINPARVEEYTIPLLELTQNEHPETLKDPTIDQFLDIVAA